MSTAATGSAAPANTAPAGPATGVSGMGWVDIVRLGLVQTALGAIVVLTTSTLNRVMIVELALPAVLPGLLVGWHYAVQMLRPRWGFGSDQGGQRTPWIIAGMALLGLGATLGAVSTAVTASSVSAGVAVAVLAFTLVGIGVGAAGTSLLALLATHVHRPRRAAAASIVWIMMIAGFVITAATAGSLLDPFSIPRLIAVVAGVCGIAFTVATLAVWGVEGRIAARAKAAATRTQGPDRANTNLGRSTPHTTPSQVAAGPDKQRFIAALGEIWQEPQARRFTVFVFVSMLAYSMQDLILEPFAGLAFAYTPGESTKLAGTQHAGVLAGMILVAVLGSWFGGRKLGALRQWTIWGCVASAIALLGLTVAGLGTAGDPVVLSLLGAADGASFAAAWPLQANVFILGASTGAFAVAAIGSMMGLAGTGRPGREGTRMGLWGAAQAIAFGLGGIVGAGAVDVFTPILGSAVPAYAWVFSAEAALFLLAAALAVNVGRSAADERTVETPIGAEIYSELAQSDAAGGRAPGAPVGLSA